MDYILKQKSNIMNSNYYVPYPTPYHLRQLGFHYLIDNENYVLTFPILRYKGRPTLLCKLVYNIVDNKLLYDIINTNNELLALYYDREYGDAREFIEKIDSIVDRKMKAMGFKKKKKQVNKIEKEK